MMDILVLGGVVVVLSIAVYLLATLGTKETTFEDAIAEQRQKREQEHAQLKAEKQHKKHKLKKGKGRKDDSEPHSAAAPATTVQEVEFEPEPEPEVSTEPEPSPRPQQEKKNKKNKKKGGGGGGGGIVEVIEEAPKKLVVEEVETIIETVEAPIVEVKVTETEVSAPVEEVMQETAPKEIETELEEQIEAPIIQVEAPVIERPIPTSTQEKKKKKDKNKNDVVTSVEEKLLPLVKGAHLSSAEIQTLIDILLNKQQASASNGGDWVEKGAKADPHTILKRQLEETEKRLEDKDEAHKNLSAKITELRKELNGERSSVVKLKQQLDETNTQQSTLKEKAESEKLNLRNSLEREYQEKMIQLQQNVNEGEMQQIKAALSESEMRTAVLKQEHDELNQRCQKYEEHISALEEKKATEIAEIQTQLGIADAARAQALADVTALQAEHDALAEQLTNHANDNTKELLAQTQSQLQEIMHKKLELESRLTSVDSELSSVRQVVHNQSTEIERLKEEKESLASQSVRPAAEGQENGEVHTEQTTQIDTAHLESLVKEKDVLIEEQATEVEKLNKEVSRLKDDLENQVAKNNEVTRQTEGKIQVCDVLQRIFPSIEMDKSLDESAFVNAFEIKAKEVLEQSSLPKEPEVVEKVVEVEKIVEKVVEKVVEDPELTARVEELIKENESLKSQVREAQEPREPEVIEKVVEVEKIIEKVVEKVVEDTSLKTRVEDLCKENENLKSQVCDLQNSVSSGSSSSDTDNSHQEEVNSLQEKVLHYQTVLADTEALLKSLQASVEGEEQAWQKKMVEKDASLKQFTADKANLELQVKQLEATIENVKQAEEMQGQLKVLQEQLSKEEKEKTVLQEELQKAQEQLTQTATQGVVSEEDLAVLRGENSKLKALVSVGQETSQQQEQVIQQLQEELTATKGDSASTNGPASIECQEERSCKD
ncbi:unnamed protein product [Meganyctiphanes norvegica]|uniref:Ribosome-binding protein 1 n=1 Tax=Meganyctiphanes norvegica TaxID=48144 RepID=A0AAV2PXZ8_MEGNR